MIVTMNTSGGFILEPSQDAQAGPSSATIDANYAEEEGSITARKLSAKQELRLMNYLDEEFLQINRGFNKRHNIKTSTVPHLDSFLQAYGAILEVVASIPPIGASVSLLVSYLLRLTSELLDGIAGYELSKQTSQITHDEENEDEGDEDNVGRDVPLLTEQLQKTIQCLTLLDKVWYSVLRGQLIDIKAARKNVERDFIDSDDYFPASEESGTKIDSGNAAAAAATSSSAVPGRYPSSQSNKDHLKEARSIIGSKGFSSVAQTDRIRLRNVVMLGKENLFAWMRIQLNVPLPPPQIGAEQEEEEVEETKEVQDTIKKEQTGHMDDSDGEQDLVEVITDRREEEDHIKREEGGDGHYNDLFARKIDPDASDSDSESRSNDQASQTDDSDQPPSKRTRRGNSNDSTAPQDVESVATFSNTATVMKWDIKFARLFANTLRCLSDIQEYRNQREANQRNTDKEDGR